MGFVWSVPVSSEDNDMERTKGGGGGAKRIIGGGVQIRFWGGVSWYVFPSPESSTPLCFSLRIARFWCTQIRGGFCDTSL